jgi:hypothetical protein
VLIREKKSDERNLSDCLDFFGDFDSFLSNTFQSIQGGRLCVALRRENFTG